MNRASRRQNKAEKPATYTLTSQGLKDTIEAELMAAKREGIKYAADAISCIFIMKLHDVFDFDQEKMDKLLPKVNLQFDCILDGIVDVTDVIDWCKQNFDFEIRSDLNRDKRVI